jgi:3-deoxy-7-phosphoheptulonate synthase
MHGNTRKTASGFKTRHFDDVVREVEIFLGVCAEQAVPPGGVHLELTGEHVVECIGGHADITEEQLAGGGYETLCDPRLNVDQALELAFRLAQALERLTSSEREEEAQDVEREKRVDHLHALLVR